MICKFCFQFPLVSRSGRIRRLLIEAKDATISRMNLSLIPGGPEAFELAAKFCYGINIEITLSNVAMLRCAAHFLEMTEEFVQKNLEARTEAYLKDTVLPNISNSISVLHRCECLSLKLDHNFPMKTMPNIEPETPSDWWGKSLSVLNLEFFQRVLTAVKSKGLKQDMISKILINYTHNSLQGLVIRDPHIVRGSLLDMELSSLLKTAIASSASTSCRSDLERRIGLQLDQAILEDILIPANSYGNNHGTMYDTESILRIFSIFLNLDEDDDEDNRMRDESEMAYDFDSPGSPKQSSILKVSKLLDTYLAEIALDTNLLPSKFIALAELLPDHARIISDGLYRAVDIFLKVIVSQESTVQMAVQVLYFEQIRLRNAMNGGHNQFFFGTINSQFPQRSSSGAGSGAISPRDNYASVRRENRELLHLDLWHLKMVF